MTGWIIGVTIAAFILQYLGQYSLFRFVFALFAAPFVGIPGFASIVFFGQIFGIGFFEKINWLSSDVYTHPMAIAMIAFFFIGFLNPRLYGRR